MHRRILFLRVTNVNFHGCLIKILCLFVRPRQMKTINLPGALQQYGKCCSYVRAHSQGRCLDSDPAPFPSMSIDTFTTGSKVCRLLANGLPRLIWLSRVTRCPRLVLTAQWFIDTLISAIKHGLVYMRPQSYNTLLDTIFKDFDYLLYLLITLIILNKYSLNAIKRSIKIWVDSFYSSQSSNDPSALGW